MVAGSEASVAAQQARGDLLTAYAHAYEPGADSVVGYDFETGDEVKVPLNGAATPIEAAAKCYKKVSKLKRGAAKTAELLEAARATLRYAEAVAESADALVAGDADELLALRDVADEVGLGDKALASAAYQRILGRPPPPPPRKAAKAGKTVGRKQARAQQLRGLVRLPLEIGSGGGYVVLAGRSSAQNDRLTHELAQPGDVWLHSRGCPGAHVVLQLPDGADAKAVLAEGGEALQAAADVAAALSKGRGDKRVPVDAMPKKFVRAQKGGAAGAVVFKEGMGVVVEGRPDRGAQLLALAAADGVRPG